jgi:integrase
MSHQIRVCVVRFDDRKTFQLQWKDPFTGKKRTQTTDIPTTSGKRGRADAGRLAGELEKQLRDESGVFPGRVSWDSFRQRYEDEVVPSLAKQTGSKIATVCNHIESVLDPGRLEDVNEQRISYFAAKIRQKGSAETTIKSYLAHLRAMLNWAVEQKLLRTLPAFPKVHRRRSSSGWTPMKGRPITPAEYELMLAAVPKVVGERDAPAWQRYLRGLWLSGLRLQESLDLHWDRQGGLIPVFPDVGKPTLLVPADLEKGHSDRILPLAPEFALFLLETPPEQRKGPVFRLIRRVGETERLGTRQVSKIVSEIGQKAGVIVRVDAKDSEKKKYASAHDFRRAFGERWAARIMPAQLKELMRHESIETTLRYYVGMNAIRTAEACWEAYERSLISAQRQTSLSQPVSQESPAAA